MEALIGVLFLIVIAEGLGILFLFSVVAQHQRSWEIIVRERKAVVASTAIRLVRS